MEKTFNLVVDNIFFNELEIKNLFEQKSKNVYNLKICTLDDVIKTPTKNFFYIIHKFGNYLQFQHDQNLMGKIPNTIKESLRTNKNFKLIFLELNESDFEETIEFVDLKMKEERLPTNQIYYIGANHKLEQLKNKCGSDLNVYTINHGQYFNCERLTLTNPDYVVDKEFLFMVHNRNLKSHRVGLMCLLKKYNLLKNIDWSLLQGSKLKELFNENDEFVSWFFPKIFDKETVINLMKELHYFADLGNKKSKFEDIFDFDNNEYRYDYQDAYKVKTYSQSYINVTTETNYESPYIVHVTEKTFNPFNFYQMPIFVSTYQHVKYLRDLYGFDMFDDLINHSYDNEINNHKRLFMIVEEIKRLNENPQLIKDFYINNKERFLKNREIIFEIMDDKKDYNFFQNLI
jgi:hypothetical protein